ncbi:peptidoglycan D,D-transpeptidase FtsI family protein [Abyssisolibacter fermentans]|uniref:peptidoglycan D,D-transpeptidase FtsI family protein n=1 Tax=Abyssisolibacter fermentans TaxID=1766203 RepID=UPI0008365989|nr:penicillin-binding transpeptidase domain-containing protein [Abyssisolibacter fermentans]
MKGIKGIKFRIYIMSIGLLLITLIMIGRLGYLQLIKGDELKIMAATQQTKDVKIAPKRGRIYDRNKKILATSLKLYTIRCRMVDVKAEEKESHAEIISEILEMDKDEVLKMLLSDKNWVEIKRWVEKEQADLLRSKKLDGIIIDEEYKRYYPRDNFAAQLIGNTNRDNFGEYGIERSCEEYLAGIPGRSIKIVDNRGNELPYGNKKIYDSVEGEDIVLTIDERIQHIADSAAQKALVETKAKRTCILIMDPNNGKILAMANKPDFNPNNRQKIYYDINNPWQNLDETKLKEINDMEWSKKQNILYQMWKNYSISGIHEPGSTFKIITWATAIEENVVKSGEKFLCDGYVKQVKGNIKCWRYRNPHGEQTLMEGFENSCNEVSCELALRLKKEKFCKYISAFGFGKKTNIDLPGEEYGLIQNVKGINDVELATMSFGQGICVTPIQMLNAVCAVVNGGNLMKPGVIERVENRQGETIYSFSPEVVKKVISKDTSKKMRTFLQAAVEEGTGKKAYIRGYNIGGKTGTAQKIVDGKYKDGYYIASFAGAAPIDNPQIAILVMIDEPGIEENHGGTLAAPIAGQVIEKVLNYLNK